MRKLATALGVLFVLTPFVANAFPFGGRTTTVLQCVYNSTIYANVGPPRGGEYIWTTGTRTYQFGPPAYAGQWLLGLAAPPYYCIYQISPLEIYTGIAITMMGSSGAAAPTPPPPPLQQTKTAPPPSIDMASYCRTRTTPPFSGSNDPCDIKGASCDQIKASGYKLVERCM